MKTTETLGAGIAALRERLGERVTVAGDAGWDAARAAWNLAADQRPAAVVAPSDVADVRAAVQIAAAHDLTVTAQGPGHAAMSYGSMEGLVLLRTAALAGVEVDAAARTARVGAGTLWRQVVEAVAPHGLIALHGSSPTVGAVGYTLGGGFCWYGRTHGLSANSVRSIDLVTADGELRRVSDANEPDLFWALRGGGGNFGVVTALELELFEAPEIFGGAVAYPMDRAPEVLAAWRALQARVGRETTATLKFLQLPPLPTVPPPLQGVPAVAVMVAHFGPGGDDAVAPLLGLGEPLLAQFGPMPPPALTQLAGDPEDPVPAVGDGLVLREIGDDTAEALLRLLGPGSGSPLVMAELRPLGGALGEARPDHGALAAIEGEAAFYGVGMAMTPELGEAVGAHLAAVAEGLAPWAGPRYLNFAERPVEALAAFPPEAARRLVQVKRQVDPRGIFRGNHVIPGE